MINVVNEYRLENTPVFFTNYFGYDTDSIMKDICLWQMESSFISKYSAITAVTIVLSFSVYDTDNHDCLINAVEGAILNTWHN